MKESSEGFEYIEGDDERPAMAYTQACCGVCVGCFKAWLPCVGCFCCCCSNPYVTVPQGSKGLLLKFASSHSVSASLSAPASPGCTT
jgi:hypothetical protein